ncbi:hypothetical protein III_06046 [Bacillus mycoides]|uniref:Uncharacterized protein n=1 Tax=Bacillus mycoides TaxID=1405 RepID=A0ABC9QVI7_BACMY|nr:hypothetical protein III_06046 [Bacillus mycoides]
MRVKKCLAIFSLMMIMCLSVLPSFASAEVKDYLKGVKAYNGFNSSSTVDKMTDSDLNTYETITNMSYYIFLY